MTENDLSGNRLPPAQHQPLMYGGLIEINAQRGPYESSPANIDGADTIAEIAMGEWESDSPGAEKGQKLYLMEVTNPDDHALKALSVRADKEGVTTSPYVLVSTTPKGNVNGMAYIPLTPSVEPRTSGEPGFLVTRLPAIIGRQGTLNWFDFGVAQERPAGWSPFMDNKRISRKQLFISASEEGRLLLGGMTENSPTDIYAADIKVLQAGSPSEVSTKTKSSRNPLGRLALRRAAKNKK